MAIHRADYVSEQMRLETNFLHEAHNAQKCAAFLADTPELRDKVYVPKVYPEVAGTERVMVMEYVKGCKITDKEKIEAMGFTPKEVMDTMIATMSAMTFKWGFVHCDPHPGNILVRPHPSDPKRPQVVLLDHGLYQDLPDKFRREYTSLWKSLFTVDTAEIQRIAGEWGINLDVNLFASAITLRPFQVEKKDDSSLEAAKDANVKPKTDYELQVELKERIRNMLENEQKIPRELIFVGRAQRITQSLNQVRQGLSKVALVRF
jgi:aarF domain-containing kinase